VLVCAYEEMARGERPGRRDAQCRDELHDDQSVGRKARDARSNSGVRDAGRASFLAGDTDADACHQGAAAESDADTAARSGGGSASRNGDSGPPDGDSSPRCHGSPSRHSHGPAADPDSRASLGNTSASAPNGDAGAGTGQSQTSPDNSDAHSADRDCRAPDS
jgi:hypothetical protein